MKPDLTPEEHKQRHIELHRAFDQLYADFIDQLSIEDMARATSLRIIELIEWSYGQTVNPTVRRSEHPTPPHQQRVIAERAALDDKREKLAVFITNSPIYQTLEHKEKSRLNVQVDLMEAYSDILSERIAAFPVDGT